MADEYHYEEPPTLTERQSHPNHWFNKAADLHAAAGATWLAMQDNRKLQAAADLGMHSSFDMGIACRPVYHMLCGLALEVIFKALMSSRRMKIDETHDLNELARRTSCHCTPHEQ